MFTALLEPIISALGGKLLDNIEDAFKTYVAGQITREQLAVKLQEALLSTFADVEKSYAASINATFDSFMKAAAQSKLMQQVWAAVALTQLIVLLWHQVGIPALVYLTGARYPSSGATVDWAYALLALCLGGGAITLKTGPGSGSMIDGLKKLVGK